MAFLYSPPANQNDLAGKTNEQRYLRDWSLMIEGIFKREIRALKQLLGTEPLFFTEADHPLSAAIPTASVPWLGFPRGLLVGNNNDRAKAIAQAEVRGQRIVGYEDAALTKRIVRPYRQQDEYLEWVPLKRNGKLAGFAFTAEGPEYWEHLAASDGATVRNLYSMFTGRDVSWAELSWDRDVWARLDNGEVTRIYHKGEYDPYNRVNLEECAAHLTHPANTLGAEINLAARATVQRLDVQGQVLSERRRLACCSDFGDANRNSDPTIGLAANQTVRGGTSITLADPVGLYIQAFDKSRIADSAGNALDGWWVAKRGDTGRTLRAEFGPPIGSDLGIADVRVGGEPLSVGGQLAELTTMTLYVRAKNLGAAEPDAQPCVSRCCVKTGSPAASSMLTQVERDAPCPKGMSMAFPELGTAPRVNPFTRRNVRRAVERDNVE